MCPGGACKLQTPFKLCGTRPWARQHHFCVQHHGTKPCIVTHRSHPADHGSSNNVAIICPDHVLPNNKHSLSSLKIEICLTVQQSKCRHQNRTSPQSASSLKIFFSYVLSGIKHFGKSLRVRRFVLGSAGG